MKRLNSQALVVAFIFVALAVALIVALPASQPLMANPPGQKVCHAPPGVVIPAPNGDALAAHLGHGDCLASGGAQLGDPCECLCPDGTAPPCDV